MANPTGMFGLKPVRKVSGEKYDGAHNKYYAPATYATALYVGDPVTVTGTGNATVISSTIGGKYAIGTLPEVNLASLGDAAVITGVIIGFEPKIDNLHVNYGAASTERVIKVADDPDLVFHIRDDGAAALPVTAVGLNAVMITGTASTLTGISGIGLDSNSDVPAADASNPLLILGVAAIPNNAVGSANCVWEVKINASTKAHGALGI